MGFSICLGRPGTSQDVVNGGRFELFGRDGVRKTMGGEEVEEDSRELAGSAALGEEDSVVVGDSKKFSKVGYGFVNEFLLIKRAIRDLLSAPSMTALNSLPR